MGSRKPSVPRPIRKPTLAAPATTNSEVSTEPITLRGSIRPETSSAGVATGPQPPPPVASTKPATRPSGARNRLRRRPAARAARSGRENRTSRYAPSVNRMAAIHGAAASVEMELRNVAPANAPIAPGSAIRPTTRQSTLPKRQCETPAASVVPISARCTEADAAAGATPANRSSVEEVSPYAMPSEPSTSCAASPTRARTSSLRTSAP